MKIMKISIALIFATLFLSLGSCKKDSGTPNSCNVEINKWSIENQARLASYTRDQLAQEHNIDTMNAIYCSLPASQKFNIWKDKLNLVKSTYGLSAAENAHIQTAIDYLQSEFWTSNETLDQFSPWAENWANEAKAQFAWDDAKVFSIAETWLTIDEMNTIKHEYEGKPNVPGGGAPDCDCRYSAGCWWLVQTCDSKATCSATYHCGVFGSSRCKGKCESSGIVN